jgi:hypothetical protein
MGKFWDAFVFRVCVGLGEGFFAGFRTAADVLRAAHRLRLLDVAGLDDLSVLLIVLTCPSGSPLHEEAVREYLRRGRTAEEDWAVLREALPPRLTDLYLLGFFGELRQTALVQRVSATLYLPALARFMARLAMEDTATARAFAAPYLNPTVRNLTYEEILDDEFLCQLYSQVVHSPWPNAVAWPPAPPAWLASIGPDEKDFIECCLALPPGDRCILYLSFYARLNAGQVACVFRDLNPAPRADDVVVWLHDSWRTVLDCLARKRARRHPHTGNGPEARPEAAQENS